MKRKPMTISEINNKFGLIEAVKACIGEEHAVKVSAALAYQEQVVEKEGVIPYDSRPTETRKGLEEASATISEAKDFIWKFKRNKPLPWYKIPQL